MLTPLDVLQLSRSLGISTSEFLDKHALTPITKDLQLPVVLLRMEDTEQKQCPFLGEGGCSVYDARPWSCRMYPLGMALPPARAGVEPEPIFFLFEDDFCDGRTEATEWSVEEWLTNQGIHEQQKIEAEFKEIVSHPWFIGGRKLDPRRIEIFHMACYDLDRFRRFVFDSTFLNRFEIEEKSMEEIKGSDEALLRFAFRWLRFALFAEPTMKVKNTESDIGRNQ